MTPSSSLSFLAKIASGDDSGLLRLIEPMTRGEEVKNRPQADAIPILGNAISNSHAISIGGEVNHPVGYFYMGTAKVGEVAPFQTNHASGQNIDVVSGALILNHLAFGSPLENPVRSLLGAANNPVVGRTIGPAVENYLPLAIGMTGEAPNAGSVFGTCISLASGMTHVIESHATVVNHGTIIGDSGLLTVGERHGSLDGISIGTSFGGFVQLPSGVMDKISNDGNIILIYESHTDNMIETLGILTNIGFTPQVKMTETDVGRALTFTENEGFKTFKNTGTLTLHTTLSSVSGVKS